MSLKEKALHLTMRLPSRKIWDGFDMLCKSSYQFPSLKLGTIHVWRPRKLTNFQDLPPPCPAMTKVLALPWPWTSNFKQTHPLSQLHQSWSSSSSLKTISHWWWSKSSSCVWEEGGGGYSPIPFYLNKTYF